MPTHDTHAKEMRPDPRGDDFRARAEARIAELEGHLVDDNDAAVSIYEIPRGIVPEGWEYEWKTETVLNQPQTTYIGSLARRGWTLVPADRHPELMPPDYKGQAIDREGMRLYEKPKALVERSRLKDVREAKQQVRQKEESLGQAPSGHFERDAREETRPKIRKSYSPVEVPKE